MIVSKEVGASSQYWFDHEKPQPRVRAAAYASLAEMLPPRGISIWESAAEDAHPYVAGTARKALRALESGH